MRRGEGDCAAARERLQRRGRQRPAFGGIRATADFVEQNQRPRPCAIENLAQGRDVRGECREACGDGLPVADVGEHPHEDRQRRVRTDGWDDTALCEQGEQADRLDQNGLATRIRTGDEDGELIREELKIERHRMVEQRMAPAADLHVAADLRHEPVHFHRIPRPRAQIVERNAHLPGGRDRGHVRPEQVGQLAQHPEHFALLGGLRRAQLIAELDDLGRFHEHGAARRRFVMDDAAHPRPRGVADRDHVAAAADRDRGVRCALALIEASEDRPQAVDHALSSFAHALAGAGEFARRAVEHLTVWGD